MNHKMLPMMLPDTAVGEGTAVRPNGQSAKLASLKHCRPNGNRMIVIDSNTPMKPQMIAIQNPFRISHKMLPMVLITPLCPGAASPAKTAGHELDASRSVYAASVVRSKHTNRTVWTDVGVERTVATAMSVASSSG